MSKEQRAKRHALGPFCFSDNRNVEELGLSVDTLALGPSLFALRRDSWHGKC